MIFRLESGKAKRDRWGRGYLQRVGKTRRWMGVWYTYETAADGTEKRRRHKKVLGPGTWTKAQARAALDKAMAIVETGGDATFSELWERYQTYKAASWSKKTAGTLVSMFKHSVLPHVGQMQVSRLTLEHLQPILMRMAARGMSRSAIGNVRTYLKASLEFALYIELIAKNPARGAKLVIPRALPRREKRVLSEDQARALLAHAHGRDRIIVRLFLVGGLRAQELFALRVDDVTPGRVRIDEAIKSVEKGAERIGEPKTEASGAYIAIPLAMETELREWIAELSEKSPSAWLFPSDVGTPIRPDNYLKRVLKPLAAAAGVAGITFQILRRTCATLMDSREHAQAQLRHTTPETTARHYRQAIPVEVRESVRDLDQRLTTVDRSQAIKDGTA